MKRLTQYVSIFFLTLFAIACSSGESSPEKVAEKYVSAIYSGDADAVIKMIYIPEEDKSAGASTMITGKLQDGAKRAKAYAEEHGGIDKVEYQPTKYLNDDKSRAIIGINVIFKDNANKNEDLKLTKVDGNWFIEVGF
ncbi:DUF4878 domain-containing protein [Gilliamella sp. W8126]|uniref:DUF4878 domain-containing protein n=1 Tax=Gilliamella sp. W8126 TaxID=2750946 RepID=UPI0018DE7F85|nr:DUF4878 domain-containing protein [Gilliamella sp. W8126]MBI0005114.1 DUF4878 domain-containing protein [Gilliamella sp. W8126]